ncbi:SDR family NAD(P)-dependent oxidoreductase [Eubacterium sp. AM05-23]|uniref:SDR family oxidoreductase n=1 Tax=Eubacterium TaxID=1730 RepID=UPI000E527EDA|nr:MULTISPECIES: SDR family oxidoreductase [Eubacterium]RHO58929.1 SDR family NAD(P)-dependent oxidoreductase [Eubacterium sp. AM05-23]
MKSEKENQVNIQTQEPQKGYYIDDSTKNVSPEPVMENPEYQGSGKLKDKVAVITGGDSGIGGAVAIAFAKEGAKLAILYLDSDDDAAAIVRRVKELGAEALSIKGDVGDDAFVKKGVSKIIEQYGHIDVLINNAGEQHVAESITEISPAQLDRTFRTNIFSMFYMVKAVLPHLNKGAAIVNTTSVTAYRGSSTLLDYSATKGAIVSFTRALSSNQEILGKAIRVNGVAPGPIWTPLIPATFSKEHVKRFGKDVPLDRPGQPYELAPAYVYLASNDSSYVTGQVIHVNGGEVVNG